MQKMRKMKDSGIEWIGEIPEGWEVHRIKNHFLIISGSGFKPELQGQSTGDFPVCKASDISSSGHYLHTSANYITTDFVKSQHFSIIPKGSILFAKIGEAMRKNNRSLCLCDCCVDNNCQGLVPKKISSEFSYYLFTCIDMTWFDNAGTIPCINNQKLYDCRFPFPSHDEQLLIANALNLQCTKINEILSHIRSSIEEYKKLKQAVITQAVTKGVRGEREMKDSGVEWVSYIPVDWNTIKLKYCTYIRARLGWRALKADEYVESGFPFLSAFNIVNNALHFTNLNYINQFRYDESPEIQLKVGDVLLVKDGAGIGKCAIVENMPTPSTVNGSIAVISSTSFITPKYLYYYFLSEMFQQHIDLLKDGMGVPHLFQSDLKEIKIAFPSKDEQKEIVDYLDAKCAEIDRLIAKKEQLVKELEGYKKSLIYEVVTGKREV